MYIRDDIADKSILENPKIRDAIRGDSVMLVVPGHAAYVLTNFMLMVGWIAASLSIYGILDSQIALVYCLAASLIYVTLLSFLSYQVIAGGRFARRRLYVYSIALGTFCAATLLWSIFHGGRAVIAVSAGGALASLMAVRLLSGTDYAVLAAFFRAKRGRRESVDGAT